MKALLSVSLYIQKRLRSTDLRHESDRRRHLADCTKSLYVGDAAGRPANPQAGTHKDHSDTDRSQSQAVASTSAFEADPLRFTEMAVNAGLPFRTPEEFFLEMPIDTRWSFSGWDPRTYNHSGRFFP
jgi:hypothetical protein